MDQVESEYGARGQTAKFLQPGFLLILRIDYRATHGLRAIISIRKRLVDPEYLALLPTMIPGCRAKAIG